MQTNLDLDLLRTLVVALDGGGFARAARLVGRSTSAVSLQMGRLEEQAGARLFRKQGRRLALTESGEVLLGYARRLLKLNDEALAALGKPGFRGTLRLGVTQDVAERSLAATLQRFGPAWPEVRVEARVDHSALLIDEVARGRLDLALAFSSGEAPSARRVAELPMTWIARPGYRVVPSAPLPVVLFEAPCGFRKAALGALDAAGIPWRIAFTSPSLSGLWAAVEAGLGVTVRTSFGMPRRLRTTRARGLPALPRVNLWLHGGGEGRPPAAAALEALLVESLGL